MPRVEGEDRVYSEETWPKILCRKLLGFDYALAEFSERARDTSSLKNSQLFYEAIECCKPTSIIIQIGIVDCAPRIISKEEKRLFNRFFFPRFIKDFIINKRKKNKQNILKKGPLLKVYVNPVDFKNNIEVFIDKIRNHYRNSKIILLPILGDYEYLSTISFGYSENIKIYNDILAEISLKKNTEYLSELITHMNKSVFYTSDGYHLNPNGNNQIAEKVFEVILV
jgi:hypothetical protein